MNLETAKFILGLKCGFLRPDDMSVLVRIDRLQPVLLRFDDTRLTCGAQYAYSLIRILERNGDVLRDVSIPVHGIEEARAVVDKLPKTFVNDDNGHNLSLAEKCRQILLRGAQMHVDAPKPCIWCKGVGIRMNYTSLEQQKCEHCSPPDRCPGDGQKDPA